MNTADRIKILQSAFAFKSYLEVGVFNGVTFNAVDIPYKVALNPHFGFDYANMATPTTKFFEMTSDRYFCAHANSEQFDLIFLDGLHTWEQTLRDFNNAVMVSTPETVIFIDDVYANDVYSSLKSDAVVQRHLHHPENNDGSWHGDVYKTALVILDFYPKLSFVTIDRGYGNPQMIVYRKTQKDFAPSFNAIEPIERLSYFDFLAHREKLNLMAESDALRVVVEHPSRNKRL